MAMDDPRQREPFAAAFAIGAVAAAARAGIASLAPAMTAGPLGLGRDGDLWPLFDAVAALAALGGRRSRSPPKHSGRSSFAPRGAASLRTSGTRRCGSRGVEVGPMSFARARGPPMTAFRGALIGCGFFARNHMHGWADAEGAEIVAVCDLDRAKAEDFARSFDATPYTDAAAMLAEVRPDFVDVATTVESHRPLVELALAHGALTVCQKPFAPSYADGLAMVEAAERAGRPLIVHENFRWQRPFRLLRAEIDAGAIGAPFFARMSFRHAYDIYANQPYLAEAEDFGLMDMGLHLFDVARFLMGDVAQLACMTQRLNPIVRGEDAFTALLRHRSGAVTSVECSFYLEDRARPLSRDLRPRRGAGRAPSS